MSKLLEVKIPDIGGFDDVPVIEVLVKPGDVLKPEDSMLTLESDKATLDVPSPAAGTVKEVKVKVGDKVSEGTVVLMLEVSEVAAKPVAVPTPSKTAPTPTQTLPLNGGGQGGGAKPQPVHSPEPTPSAAGGFPTGAAPRPGLGEEENAPPPVVLMPGPAEMIAQFVGGPRSHASPSVRRFARELGVDVARVKGSGPKNRILKEDIQNYVKAALSGARPAAAGGLDLLPWPKIDYAKFGSFEARPLSRIKKISGANLSRNWVMIPHVTQFDEVDITALEQQRVALNKQNEKIGIKVTILAYLVKAAVETLKQFPEANSSLDGDNLIVKHYYHIGFAADTPNGLVVPVIKDADQKSITEIAQEASSLAKKARDGKLSPAEMQGGCFSISSLGGIGGMFFTPIINAPEVAILGVSKSEYKPKWNGKAFAPRLMLPLSLSYDHRVVDGAAGARFITALGQALMALGAVPARAAPAGKPSTARPKAAVKKPAPKKKPAKKKSKR